MTWSIIEILTCLQRIGLKCLAKKQGLSISRKNSELRTRIANYYQSEPEVCLSDLRKKDLRTLFNCYSENHNVYLPGVAALSKVRRISILKGILFNNEDLKEHGFRIIEPSRDYQKEAVIAGNDALDHKTSPVCIQIPTGAGKTRVGNNVIAERLRRDGGIVVYISKDWRLLRQAAEDLSQRFPTLKTRRYGGDTGKLPLRELDSDKDFTGVIYTSLHTFYRRGNVFGHLKTVILVVWDECHYGQNGKMGRHILRLCKKKIIPVLGLTATPRDSDTYYIAFQRSFFELVRAGWLAEPIIVEPVPTGISWSPELDRRRDFNRNSLRELGDNNKRNKLIAEHYNDHSEKYQQTLVFACNIEHAIQLEKAFKQIGVAVASIHSAIPEDHQSQKLLQEFCKGTISVLVNVEMLTHGVDLPSVKTIFLCRPTASQILFAQMIGRGCRLQEGKSSFYIVEFTDNVKKHNDFIISTKTYFNGAGSPEPYDWKTGKRPERRKRHEYIPDGHAVWIGDDASIPESVRGLWLMRGQTFGIEFELSHPDMPNVRPSDPEWSKIAKELLSAIRTVTPLVAEEPIYTYAGADSGYGKDCSLWNLEFDSSVGWEITSRILSDEGGYLEIDQVCEVLDNAATKLGLKVNYKTGTHVHLGWNNRPLDDLKRIVRLVRFAEPALATLVAPSRLAYFDGNNYNLDEPNEYCEPISVSASQSKIKSWKSLEDVKNSFSTRYVTLNLCSLFAQETVEVRMHSGTLEARKILLWTSLLQQMLWGASVDRRIPVTEDRYMIEPDGDILKFARHWLPNANEPVQALFLCRLANRRDEIVEIWHANSELVDWVDFRDNWQGVD